MKPSEKERLRDSAMLLRSAKKALEKIDSVQLPQLTEIQDCVDSSDKALTSAVARAEKEKPKAGETETAAQQAGKSRTNKTKAPMTRVKR